MQSEYPYQTLENMEPFQHSVCLRQRFQGLTYLCEVNLLITHHGIGQEFYRYMKFAEEHHIAIPEEEVLQLIRIVL